MIESEDIGRVHSTNDAMGNPAYNGTGQVGQTLTAHPGDPDQRRRC